MGQAFRYGGNTTIILVTNNLTVAEITKIQHTIAAGNYHQGRQAVNLVIVNSADKVANYFNSKTTTSDKISKGRLNDKITDVAIFGHGIPGSMEFGYDWVKDPKSPDEQQRSFGKAQINKLDPQAFNNANICLSTCNSAADKDGVNVAKDISKQTNSKVSGYDGLSTYRGIYDLFDRALKKFLGVDILPAGKQPTADPEAVKKIYKNGAEQKN